MAGIRGTVAVSELVEVGVRLEIISSVWDEWTCVLFGVISLDLKLKIEIPIFEELTWFKPSNFPCSNYLN